MHQYTYYPDGSLQHVKNAGGTSTLASYTYTPNGLLASASYNGRTLTNTWSGGNRIGLNANGSEYEFVYDIRAGVPAVIEEVTPTGTVRYFREPGGELIARVEGESVHYYHFDELGSTHLITDSDGDVTDTYAYDAYGALLAHERYEGSVDQPYQYVGKLGYYTHYQEPEFGLLQLGLRFYDPDTGRFTQKDPAMDGINQFVYADANPAVGVDPSGRFAIVIGACVIGGAELALAAIYASAAVACFLCGQDEECRQAVADAANELAGKIGGLIDRAKEEAAKLGKCCKKKIRIKCDSPWNWLHITHRDKFLVDGKICWMNHIQINCWLPGFDNTHIQIRRPIGPCYKHRTGPVTH